MSITTTFDPPQPSDSPSVFNSKAFSTLGGLNTWSGEANALAEAVNADADTATAKASDASESASSALTAKNAAEAAQEGVSASALIATTKATEAEESAADALTAKNAAEAAAVASSGKVNTVDPTTSGTLTHSGDANFSGGTVSGITKAMVGLPNVDNTPDASKPVSTAQLAALNDKVSETITLPAGIDVNTVVTSGFYRVNTGASLPVGANNYGQLIVSSGGGTCTQIYTDYTSSRLFTRTGLVTSETITGSWAELIDSANNQTIGGTKTFSNNVGIGGAPSTYGLQKTLSIGSTTYISGDGSVYSLAAAYCNNLVQAGAEFKYATSNCGAAYVQEYGSHNFYSAPTGVAGETAVTTLRMRVSEEGQVLATNSTGLGYGVGSGGTVTQATSKTTPVILHKPCGQITMHNAALAAGAIVVFPFYSSAAGLYDTLTTTFTQDGTTDPTFYNIWAQAFVGGEGFNVFVKNISASSHSDAIQFNFEIRKGSIA